MSVGLVEALALSRSFNFSYQRYQSNSSTMYVSRSQKEGQAQFALSKYSNDKKTYPMALAATVAGDQPRASHLFPLYSLYCAMCLISFDIHHSPCPAILCRRSRSRQLLASTTLAHVSGPLESRCHNASICNLPTTILHPAQSTHELVRKIKMASNHGPSLSTIKAPRPGRRPYASAKPPWPWMQAA